MTQKVYGFSSAGQHLTGGLDYFLLDTAVDIRATGVYAPLAQDMAWYSSGNVSPSLGDFPILPVTINGVTYSTKSAYDAARASQIALDKLIEVIATRGQPVIMGIPATGGTNGFVFRWASEHRDAWYNLSQGPNPQGPNETQHFLSAGSYQPAVPATGQYDAVPDLVETIVAALGSSFTLYPGTPDQNTVTWSTAFTTGNTKVTVTQTL